MKRKGDNEGARGFGGEGGRKIVTASGREDCGKTDFARHDRSIELTNSSQIWWLIQDLCI